MDFSHPERPQRPEPILPMVNLVFLLLVFFLMVATLAPPPPAPVAPPRAPAPDVADLPVPRLALTREGRLVFGEQSGEAAIAAARDAAAAGGLTLYADRAAPAESLAATLTRLGPTPVVLVVAPKPP